MTEQKRVGILIFPNVEILDFCGPYEVFSITRLNRDYATAQPSPFDVVTVAETTDPLTATGGLKVLPDYSIDDCPPLDILVVPGGMGTRQEVHNERLLGWIAQQSEHVETTTSVCTGSVLLGMAGVLNGKPATTHWLALDRMAEAFPDVAVIYDQHVVETDNILTSAGVSAGIDMALRVVARYHGEAVARYTAKLMEYSYSEDNRRRVEIAT